MNSVYLTSLCHIQQQYKETILSTSRSVFFFFFFVIHSHLGKINYVYNSAYIDNKSIRRPLNLLSTYYVNNLLITSNIYRRLIRR